jgi:predicted nucleic acid-binding protein
MADLAIAATAVAHDAVLITANPKDLKLIRDLVVVRVL